MTANPAVSDLTAAASAAPACERSGWEDHDVTDFLARDRAARATGPAKACATWIAGESVEAGRCGWCFQPKSDHL